MTKSIFLCLGAAAFSLCLSACDALSPDEDESVTYPVDRLLNDTKGRPLDVSIQGRSPNHISFVRKSDGKQFDFAIADLAPSDQTFVHQLPINLERSRTLGSKKGPTPPYIANREKEIAKLTTQVERLIEDKKYATKSTSAGFKRDLDRAKAEIRRLQRQIEVYSEQNPPK